MNTTGAEANPRQRGGWLSTAVTAAVWLALGTAFLISQFGGPSRLVWIGLAVSLPLICLQGLNRNLGGYVGSLSLQVGQSTGLFRTALSDLFMIPAVVQTAFVMWRRKERLPASTLTKPFALLLVALVVGAGVGVATTGHLTNYVLFNRVFGACYLIAGYYVLARYADSWDRMMTVARWFVVGVSLANVAALVAVPLALTGVPISAFSPSSLRLYGWVGQPNLYGGILMMAAMIELGLLWSPSSPKEGRRLRWVNVWLLGLGLLLTISRSSWLATSAAGTVMLAALLFKASPYFNRRWSYRLAVGGWMMVPTLALAAILGANLVGGMPSVAQRMSTLRAFGSRVQAIDAQAARVQATAQAAAKAQADAAALRAQAAAQAQQLAKATRESPAPASGGEAASGAMAAGATASGATLSGATASGAMAAGATASGATLSGATASGATASGATAASPPPDLAVLKQKAAAAAEAAAAADAAAKAAEATRQAEAERQAAAAAKAKRIEQMQAAEKRTLDQSVKVAFSADGTVLNARGLQDRRALLQLAWGRYTESLRFGPVRRRSGLVRGGRAVVLRRHVHHSQHVRRVSHRTRASRTWRAALDLGADGQEPVGRELVGGGPSGPGARADGRLCRPDGVLDGQRRFLRAPLLARAPARRSASRDRRLETQGRLVSGERRRDRRRGCRPLICTVGRPLRTAVSIRSFSEGLRSRRLRMTNPIVKTRRVGMSAPDIGPREVELVNQVLQTSQLSIGPMVLEFERLAAARVGATHAIATSSGTAGLHLCVVAAGIGAGDEVITTPFSFVASANVALYERAVPVFVDIDPHTLNIDPALIEARITSRTRAILPVHVFGQPADMDPIRDIARRHGLVVIEDACEAIGATYKGRPAGALGDAGTFAFYPNKQMTTGEGGLIVTSDERLATLCRSLRNQGRDSGDGWLDHSRLGFNYRLTELQAALGIAQIERLDELLDKRAAVAARYDALLAGCDGLEWTAIAKTTTRMSWFVYVVRLAESIDRDGVIRRLGEAGVDARPYFPPVHLQKYFRQRFGHGPGDFPVCEREARRMLALPFHGHLPVEDAEYVAEALAQAIRMGSRRA